MKLSQKRLFLISVLCTCAGTAEDTRTLQPDGFQQIELVSAVKAVAPGEPFHVGLIFTLSPDYHTYWRGPGVVGVAPSFEWDLPEGFRAGSPYWPAPEVVDMVGIKANGYHDEVLIITEITPPETLEGKGVSIKVRSAWMACASSCHPGVGDFSMTLPVQKAGSPAQPNEAMTLRFERTLMEIPPAAPDDWKWKVSRKDSTITLRLNLPDAGQAQTFEGVHFFCDDMQVNSDLPQTTRIPSSGKFNLVQKLPVPDFAPKEPQQLSGLLFNVNGWPGLDSNYVEVAIPWPTAPTNHE